MGEAERSSLPRRLLARDNHEVIASAASLPNSRKLSRSYLQGPLQATSVMTSNRTEHGRLRHKKRADLMRAISFRRCEGRPKRTHKPEGNCQRCLDPFHDARLYF